MNSLQIEDVFEPYYAGRKPFPAPKPAAQGDDDRADSDKPADAKAVSPTAKAETVTEH